MDTMIGILLGVVLMAVALVIVIPEKPGGNEAYYTALGQCMQSPQGPTQSFEELYKACDALAKTRTKRIN